MTAINTPRDRYNLVWIIFFIMGLGTLLPWNFFITATKYFTNRLKVNQTGNGTEQGAEDSRSILEANFSSTMTLCAMVPLLIFTCLNSFIHQKIPQKLRIVGSLLVIFGVFMITAMLVKVDMAPLPFFSITMIKIVCINSFGAVLQGSLFGLAGLLPASYTTPIMSGQGLAGTFAAVSMICAIATGSDLKDSAFGYFITACVVILMAVASYLALPRLEFFQYYLECNRAKPTSDEENKMDLLKKENPGVTSTDEESRPVAPVFNIFKQIWVMALSVCFIFAITIGTFPTVTVEVRSIVKKGLWVEYFIPVSCFLIFNVMDWAGRSLTALCMWPGKDSKMLPILVVLRVVFVPLFMLCNVQPRTYTSVVFEHDAWYIVFMILFAFSNGYLASLCMCYGPKKVPPHESETAGAIMAFFLSLGLALGAALSFAIRALV
ncbi:hypothetical protein AGOR_G00213390 [Albula goreensis]|uniref:Equilibrative nucleoside transporter 1 n=1 Tax=Albula goreensis TaxID=1534307 RepID=A0A8T3CRM4_9TELE|nr:hypothetical protein AGOR_G00213390 [Albula goreensis]